jgi:hypothetical protein
MVAAINAGLEQRLFGLSPIDNWWPGGAPESQECERYTYCFSVGSNQPAIASVDAISGGELSIYVVLNPLHSQVEPDHFGGLREGNAFAHGWIERRLGAWIQDGGESFSCKRLLLPQLAQLKIEPAGYADQGSFIL